MSTTIITDPSRPEGSASGRSPLGARSTAAVALTVALLHVLGGTLVILAAGAAGDAWYVVGLAVTAYLLGARHAFDADHIAAIDNATRKLSFENRPSTTVGFWFSLGHSTVVLVTVGFLLVGVGALVDAVNDDESVLRQVFGHWGTAASLSFVIVFGCINLVGLVRLARQRRNAGRPAGMAAGGGVAAPVSALLRPYAHLVDRPARMYLVGLLFGLGFDTAATIGLFVTAGTASMAVSWQIAVAMPLLFAAGMCLFDTLDGVMMTRMYSWAGEHDSRRTRYDIAITALSVLAAFVVAAVGVSGVAAELTGSSFDPGEQTQLLGFAIVAAFLAFWLIALVARRHRRAPDSRRSAARRLTAVEENR